ncbi:MAG: acetylxylan esterase [Planctomycetes bacterium]|nr:acetylxylan esterase [Planctomycetota bacterium]
MRFEGAPGLWVGANLWRPSGRGPFPVVLHPHGHWDEGRLADDVDGSTIALLANFARRGYVGLAWDMIGYNDTRQLSHSFTSRRAELYGITILGLQLRVSLSALEFALSLPEVDPNRIGVTGASGGGSQAILLAAVDERIAASAPVCMVSSTMQGGCVCENAPGLRVDASNVEIAALAAPRPQLLVSATGDWTARTPSVEFPALREVYRLHGAAAEERLGLAHFRAAHGYHRPMREAVYSFFDRWLRPRAPAKVAARTAEVVFEEPYASERIEDLLFHAGGGPPPGALRGRALVARLIEDARSRAAAAWPAADRDARRSSETIRTGIRHALGVEVPADSEVNRLGQPLPTESIQIGREGRGDSIPVTLYGPPVPREAGGLRPVAAGATPRAMTLVMSSGGRGVLRDGRGAPRLLLDTLLQSGREVVTADLLGLGEAAGPDRRLLHREAVAGFLQELETYFGEAPDACGERPEVQVGLPAWPERSDGSRRAAASAAPSPAARPRARSRRPPPASVRILLDHYFRTYNRPDDAERVQDILTLLAWGTNSRRRLELVCLGRTGPLGLLACALAPGRVATAVLDLSGFDPASDQAWLRRLDLAGLRLVGGLEAAAFAAAPTRLHLFGVRGKFDARRVRAARRSLGSRAGLVVCSETIGDPASISRLLARASLSAPDLRGH